MNCVLISIKWYTRNLLHCFHSVAVVFFFVALYMLHCAVAGNLKMVEGGIEGGSCFAFVFFYWLLFNKLFVL